MLLTLKQLLKDMCYQTTKGKYIIFQLTKGRYDEALMIGSHHRRERDRGMQLSLVLLGKDYTHTNTQIYKYTQLFNLSFITETQIQNTGTCLARIIQIQIHTGLELNSYYSNTNTESTLAEACQSYKNVNEMTLENTKTAS